MSDAHEAMVRLAAEYDERGDPTGWFEEFYARAGGDIARVYWADREASPVLLSWLDRNAAGSGARAVAVGCGLGDDAQAMAAHGYRVTGFDIAPSAIAMCRARYPDSEVEYRVADLLEPPEGWRGGFDLVYECNTIQILRGELRRAALDAIAGLAAPGGTVLVSCRSCERGSQGDVLPIPLDRDEIDGFLRAGLVEQEFLAYDDDQDPPVPHFFAVYRRP